MHLAEQLNDKLVVNFKKIIKKFEKIITIITKKSLKITLKSFDVGYRILSSIFGLVRKIVMKFWYVPTKPQLAYMAAVLAVGAIVYHNTGVAEEVHTQLRDTTQQLEQSEEVIENLEVETQKIDTQLQQKEEKLEEAETDIEKLEKEKEAKDAEILRLEQELQAKLQRQQEAQLAAVQAQQAAEAAPVAEPTPAPQPQLQTVAATGSYNDGNNYPHGECTWGADVLAGVPNGLGNASQWSHTLPQHGYVATNPTPGAVVVFQPGVHGAGGWGHVAVVASVNGDGTVTIGESNFAGVRAITYRTINPAGAQFFVR